jgi:hypothetical protein
VQTTRLFFGPLGFGAWLKPEIPGEDLAVARAQAELAGVRREVLARIAEGGFPQAVCRIVLATMVSTGSFERRSLRLARLLADLPPEEGGPAHAVHDWRRLMVEEARLSAVAPVEALNALAQMLPDTAARERALAMAAAVMMIEPTLHNPASEIIEMLIGMLGIDPDRVIDMALGMTTRVAQASHAPPARPAQPAKTRTPAAPAPRARAATSSARRSARPPGRAVRHQTPVNQRKAP